MNLLGASEHGRGAGGAAGPSGEARGRGSEPLHGVEQVETQHREAVIAVYKEAQHVTHGEVRQSHCHLSTCHTDGADEPPLPVAQGILLALGERGQLWGRDEHCVLAALGFVDFDQPGFLRLIAVHLGGASLEKRI